MYPRPRTHQGDKTSLRAWILDDMLWLCSNHSLSPKYQSISPSFPLLVILLILIQLGGPTFIKHFNTWSRQHMQCAGYWPGDKTPTGLLHENSLIHSFNKHLYSTSLCDRAVLLSQRTENKARSVLVRSASRLFVHACNLIQ